MSTKTNQKTTPKISSLVRHRKVIRDSIQGITKPAIARICQTAGVKRISGYLYEELRGVLLTEVRKLLIPSIAFMQHSRRRTVQSH